MTTQERIDELRRLEAAATPGPWSERGLEILVDINTPKYAHRIAKVDWRDAPDDERLSKNYHEGIADAAFIAAARNALPELLAEITVLRKEQDDLELIGADLATTLAQSLRERAEKAEATNGPTGICETCQSHAVKQADEANARALKAEAERDKAKKETELVRRACNRLVAAKDAVIHAIEKPRRDEFIATRTLDSEREANAILTEELAALRGRLARLEEAANGVMAAADRCGYYEIGGVGGQTIEAALGRSVLRQMPAKPIEALRAALQGK